MNVYGGSQKKCKPNTDLNLCSKSEEQINISPNTRKPPNNGSSNVSSMLYKIDSVLN